MGVYSTYLDTLKSFEAITIERKKQLQRISDLRKRDVMVIAAAIGKPGTSIDHSDLIPIADQMDALAGDRLDVILETPGGSGEITEEIVRLLRSRYKELNFIVPGTAKSAGTIMVMAGDEILMGTLSSLGPIDAQLSSNGKQYSAEAFLQGIDEIKKESDKTQSLNRAYIPILQGISPGEIEAAKNALRFGKELAAKWLEEHKFSHWVKHSKTGAPVTPEERKARASQIAEELGSHKDWLSHRRSIKLEDLTRMGIRITNFEESPELFDAIRRYHTLLRMSFEINLIKIYETPRSQVFRFLNQPVPAPASAQQAEAADFNFTCPKCKQSTPIQAFFVKGKKPAPPKLPFPADNKFTCPRCQAQADMTNIRMQIEAQAKKPIV